MSLCDGANAVAVGDKLAGDFSRLREVERFEGDVGELRLLVPVSRRYVVVVGWLCAESASK